MAPLDIVTIILYFVLLAGIGVFVFRKKQKTSEEYFLAGRSITWVFIMASLFATDMSSTAFTGQAGQGYKTGLLYANFQWVAVVCILVLVMWLLPIYLRNRIITMPEFLERRYGRSARTVYSAICILLYLLVEIPAVLYVGSLLLGAVTKLDPLLIFLVLGILTGVYTVAGGLRAVVYADFLQATFILVGGLYLGYASLNAVGGNHGVLAGWSALRSILPAGRFHAVQGSGSDIPWAAVLTGLPVLGLWYWTTNQMILQRVLGARTVNEGRIGALGAGVLKFTLPPMLVLPGMCAAALPQVMHDFPVLAKPDDAYPMLIAHLVPIGFRGLVVASFVAAMMSHVEGALNSASTMYVQDIHLRLVNPSLSDDRAIRYGKLVGFIMIVGALIIATQLKVSSVYDFLQQGYSYIAAPAVVLFLGGVFWKRANLAGAIAAYVGGIGAMGGIEAYNHWAVASHFATVNAYLQVAWAALAALVFYVVASLVSAPPSEEHVASGAPYRGEALSSFPVLKRWPIWAAICVIALVITYWLFW